jgi:hypothetical protein
MLNVELGYLQGPEVRRMLVMKRLNIADLIIEVNSNTPHTFEKFNIFSTPLAEKPELVINVESCKYINKPEGNLIVDDEFKYVCNSAYESTTHIYTCAGQTDKVIYSLEVNRDWSRASVKYLEGTIHGEWVLAGPAGEIVFRNKILFKQGMVLHASAIEYEGKGIVFSAPSGTGKSTQANLWRQHMGARVLNGDRPALKVKEGKAYVYGTPWSGSSPEYLNLSSPLRAVILLEQAPKNTIRQLSMEEAVLRLMPRCFLPYHNKELMEMAVTNVESIIKATPVYLLSCRPDLGAVELVKQCVV